MGTGINHFIFASGIVTYFELRQSVAEVDRPFKDLSLINLAPRQQAININASGGRKLTFISSFRQSQFTHAIEEHGNLKHRSDYIENEQNAF